MKKRILVLCTGNSCRSQMAEGYLRYFAGNKADVYSAGTETHGVNPMAVVIMKEDGIDISGHTSDHVDQYHDIFFDFVITVCDNAREQCPFFAGTAVQLHHNFTDPARATGTEEEIRKQFRKTRKEIRDFCRNFVATYL